MPAYHPQRIEPKWQAYWEREQDLPRRGPRRRQAQVLRPRHVPLPQRRRACTSAIPRATPRPTSSAATSGCAASTSCTRWAGTPSACPPSSTRSRPARTRAITTQKNIDTFRRQIKSLGFCYDWDREVDTTDPELLQVDAVDLPADLRHLVRPRLRLDRRPGPQPARARAGRSPSCRSPTGTTDPDAYRDSKRLAYRAEVPVNWCPELGTVLANEEVIDGKSERGGHPVVRMPLRQWMLRITAYAERLVDDLELVDWPRAIKEMQRNWIGRSEGAEVDFFIGDDPSLAEQRRKAGFPRPDDDVIRVFTTRPDTLFGATYMVLAPEHPLVDRLTTPEQRDAVDGVSREAAAARATSTGPTWPRRRPASSPAAYAINPVNGEQIPIWIADYVLMGYGTGAIMAVPGHDERDFEFARTFDLPIVRVVAASGSTRPTHRSTHAEAEPGVAVNSRERPRSASTACRPPRPRRRSPTGSTSSGLGRKTVNYKLRDWLFSRQRYWGEPFPIVLDEDDRAACRPRVRAAGPAARAGRLQADRQARAAARQGDRVGPLRRQVSAARPTRCRSGPARAGTTCATSTRKNDERPGTRELEKYWMPVDLYVGGAEHAVLHLLYSRFWHKVLFDRGHVSTPEPFQRLVNQGMILGETEYTGYRDEPGSWVSASRGRRRPSDGHVVEGAQPARPSTPVKLDRGAGRQEGRGLRPGRRPDDPGRRPGPQDVEEPGQRHQPRRRRRGIRRRQPAALRDVHGTARGGQAVEHEGRRGRLSVPGPGLADDRRRRGRRRPARPEGAGRRRRRTSRPSSSRGRSRR